MEQDIIKKKNPFADMVNAVDEGKYDIAVGAFHFMIDRAERVNFTYLMHKNK
jgi:hypothetical protein